MSEIETSAWDGRPDDPEQDGWHWLQALPGDHLPGKQGPWPVQWSARYDLWNGAYPPAHAVEHWTFLGPCITPAERDALAALLEKAEGMAEALETLNKRRPDESEFWEGMDTASTALAAWRAAKEAPNG